MAQLTVRLEATEAEFQSTAIEYALLRGWLVNHQRPARVRRGGKDSWATAITGHAGWPDVVFAREGRLVVAEFKTRTGRVGPKQKRWHAVLETIGGIEFFVWRPADWAQIQVVLR